MQFRQTKLLLIPCILVLLSLILRFIVYASQPLQVSATVPPRSSDFQFNFTSTDGQTFVHQNQVLTYQITYGAKPSAGQTTTVTITADYRHDSMSGIDLLDYVAGSATNGYGGATPIIDLVNRTIQWTISLPEGVTDQTITFSLQVNNDYIGDGTVPLTITASAQTQFFSLGELSDTKTYTTDPSLVTPSPTPSPTITPAPLPATPRPVTPQPGTVTPTKIPTQQPTVTPPVLLPGTKITSVSITSISQTDITLDVITSLPTTLELHYGINPNLLNQITTSSETNIEQTMTLAHLLPDTKYYMQLFAGNSTSDVYVIQTAKNKPVQNIALQTLLFTSNGILLSTPQSIDVVHQSATIVLPSDADFEINFALSQSIPVQSLLGVIKHQSVLGINTFSSFYKDETMIPIVEKQPGVFRLQLKAPHANGLYTISIKIHDGNGNITNQPLATLKVIHPLQIMNSTTQQPIKEARVFLYRYNYLSKQFDMLPPYDGNTQNPAFSSATGIVPIVLPQGKYRIVVSAFGYDNFTNIFTIGGKDGDEFPIVKLQSNLWSIRTFTNFLRTTTFDGITALQIFSKLIAASHNVFILTNALIVTLTCWTLILWSSRRYVSNQKYLYRGLKSLSAITGVCFLLLLLLTSIFSWTFGLVTALPSLLLCLANMVILVTKLLW